MQKLRYKLVYWKRLVWLALGLCPKCSQRVNYTAAGRPICPECGR